MKYFIIGLFFALLMLPFIEGIVNIWNGLIEYICTWFAVKIYMLKKDLPDDNDEEEENEPCSAIGFQYVPPEEEEENENEE